MNYQASARPTTDRARGRGYVWSAIGVCILAIVLVVVQYALKVFREPWYVPAFTTIAALMVLVALSRRRTVTRVFLFVLITALAAFQWYFIVSLSRLPTYEGPAKMAQQVPAFQTTRADGGAFTDQDLADGTPTVLTFFRGRW